MAVFLAVGACSSGDDSATTTTTTVRASLSTTSTSTSVASASTTTTVAATSTTNGNRTTTSTTPTSTSTTAAPGATTAASPPPPTTTRPVKVVGTPDAAAQGLYAAWKSGDKAAAAKFADPEVITELFSRPFTGPDEQFLGCDPDGVTYNCTYLYAGGSTNFRTIGDPDAGYRVAAIGQVAD